MRYFRSLMFDVNGLGTRCSLFSRIFFVNFSRNDATGEFCRGAPTGGFPSRGAHIFQKKNAPKKQFGEYLPPSTPPDTKYHSGHARVLWEGRVHNDRVDEPERAVRVHEDLGDRNSRHPGVKNFIAKH